MVQVSLLPMNLATAACGQRVGGWLDWIYSAFSTCTSRLNTIIRITDIGPARLIQPPLPGGETSTSMCCERCRYKFAEHGRLDQKTPAARWHSRRRSWCALARTVQSLCWPLSLRPPLPFSLSNMSIISNTMVCNEVQMSDQMPRMLGKAVIAGHVGPSLNFPFTHRIISKPARLIIGWMPTMKHHNCRLDTTGCSGQLLSLHCSPISCKKALKGAVRLSLEGRNSSTLPVNPSIFLKYLMP